MTFDIRENWVDQSKTKGAADVYNMVGADGGDLYSIKVDLLATSFFLPRDILQSEGVRTSAMLICNQETFVHMWESVFKTGTDLSIHSDVSPALLLRAKNVGVSARKFGGKLFIVCKVWYGNTPDDSENSKRERLQKFLRFCTEK